MEGNPAHYTYKFPPSTSDIKWLMISTAYNRAKKVVALIIGYVIMNYEKGIFSRCSLTIE